jgi:hypothetical protein
MCREAGQGWDGEKMLSLRKSRFAPPKRSRWILAHEFRERTPLRNQAKNDPDFPYCHRFAIPGQGCYAVQPR